MPWCLDAQEEGEVVKPVDRWRFIITFTLSECRQRRTQYGERRSASTRLILFRTSFSLQTT